MPGGDRTGPLGGGSMTGGRRGYCVEPEAPQFARRGFGARGFRCGGNGAGWGLRNRFRTTGTPRRMRGAWDQPTFADVDPGVDTELEWLEQRSATLRVEQQQIKARLEELEQKTD